jgi:hypothetical protein
MKMGQYKKTALVCGAGGFIGSHMVKRLRSEGYWVRGVDIKYPEYSKTQANEFIVGDLNIKVSLVISTIWFRKNMWILLMRSISMLLIWVALDTFSVEKMILR